MARFIAIVLGVLNTCESISIQERTRMNMSLSSMLSSKALSAVNMFADKLMEPGADVNSHALMKNVEQNLDFGVAQKMVLQQNIPSDVASLVQSGHAGAMNEDSLAKARKALNKMYEAAWVKLDKALGACKGFQERFEENDGAVTRDLNRLVERINDLVRVESEATLGIENIRKDKKTTRDTERREIRAYNLQRADDKADLTIFKNDLQVFAFIVDYTGTECQKDQGVSARGVTNLAQVCSVKKGPNKGQKYLSFADKKVQEGYEKILTPSAKKKIQDILQEVEGDVEVTGKKPAVSFLQRLRAGPSNSGSSASSASSATTTAAITAVTSSPPPLVDKLPVLEDYETYVRSEEENCGDGCTAGDCFKIDDGFCPIHDKLSLLWGEHKDKVDELTMDMMHKDFEFEEMKRNIASQIRILDASESKLVALLSETKSNLAADRSEIKVKYALKRRLKNQYRRKTKQMKKSICWIACQDMAAVKIVRNAVLETSTRCPSADIVDCVVEDWVPAACSKDCDDSCTVSDPFKCGGWMTMTREVMVNEDGKCGIKCPKLSLSRRCGQVKCPLDCVVSEWSGFSECSAECGGGVKKMTRSVLSDAENGGKACPIAEDIENCNDQSCDEDCVLQDWTKWSGCSVACGGGISTRRKHVLIPIKANGKCASPDALGERFEEKTCNEHQCAGDEICIAKQDLIVAVDSSSSIAMHQDGNGIGFNVLKKFTKKLLKKYEKKYFGNSKMQMGLILFGNGAIVPGTHGSMMKKGVTPALLIEKLTGNLDVVRNAVCAKDDDEQCTEAKSKLKYKKGFTNLAQAFAMAERMFMLRPTRNDAAHAVMVITDGIASFKYQTTEMAMQLQDKNIMRYFIAVTKNGINSDVMQNVKKWASDPWDTNVLHIKGGLSELQADPDFWAGEAVVKFCPQAYSPSVASWEIETYGWEEVIDSGYCGEIIKRRYLGYKVFNVEDCAGRAMNAGYKTFLMGNYHMRGRCIGGSLDGNLTEAWGDWQATIIDPKCPPLDSGSKISTAKYVVGASTLVPPTWHMYWNFYAIKPVS